MAAIERLLGEGGVWAGSRRGGSVNEGPGWRQVERATLTKAPRWQEFGCLWVSGS